MARHLLLALVAALVLLVAGCARGVEAWTWTPTDMNFGPCVWWQYAPQCDQSPNCAALGAPASTNPPLPTQSSPVDFTTAALTNDRPPVDSLSAVASSLCVMRAFPAVSSTDPVSGIEMDDTITETVEATLLLELDGGSVPMARCRPDEPLFLMLSNCDEAGQLTLSATQTGNPVEASPIASGLVGTYEVMAIYFNNGLMHVFNSENGENFPHVATDLEVEIYLRKATDALNAAQGAVTYTSQCFVYTKDHVAPDLVLSVFLHPTYTSSYVNVSVITRLIDAIGFAATQLSAGSGSVIEIPDTFPFFSFPAVGVSGLEGEAMVQTLSEATSHPIIYYLGSDVTPPCSASVPRLLFPVPMVMPSAVATAINTASDNTNSGLSALTFPILPTTAVKLASAFQIAHSTTNQGSGGGPQKNGSGMGKGIALPLLLVANCVLAFYALILLFARWEWIAWPTTLGGLNHPVQFYMVPVAEGDSEGRSNSTVSGFDAEASHSDGTHPSHSFSGSYDDSSESDRSEAFDDDRGSAHAARAAWGGTSPSAQRGQEDVRAFPPPPPSPPTTKRRGPRSPIVSSSDEDDSARAPMVARRH